MRKNDRSSEDPGGDSEYRSEDCEDLRPPVNPA